TAQAIYSTALMLYAWEDGDKHARSRAPHDLVAPKTSFTVMLPARHEEAVIADTIQRLVELRYPAQLVQILVVMESGDHGTIDIVRHKITELHQHGIDHVELVTFDDPPINKPHGLNVGLTRAK